MTAKITVNDTGLEIRLIEVGVQGPPGPDSISGAETISPVLLTDLLVIERDGTVYKATVADVLTAGGSQASHILTEDGGFILQEDGSKILTEDSL